MERNERNRVSQAKDTGKLLKVSLACHVMLCWIFCRAISGLLCILSTCLNVSSGCVCVCVFVRVKAALTAEMSNSYSALVTSSQSKADRLDVSRAPGGSDELKGDPGRLSTGCTWRTKTPEVIVRPALASTRRLLIQQSPDVCCLDIRFKL